jgi:hypothetical protein
MKFNEESYNGFQVVTSTCTKKQKSQESKAWSRTRHIWFSFVDFYAMLTVSFAMTHRPTIKYRHFPAKQKLNKKR